jgi:RNA polymerase sigma-70 factor (ECF subfamily)
LSSGATDQSLFPLFPARHRALKVSASASSTSPSDEELLLRVEAGDYSAVEPLFDKYSTTIFRIGLRILHDRGEAEDLVQDVFLHLCEKVKGFNVALGSARTWIIQITYRRAFDRRSYLTRRKFYHGTDVQLLANTLGIGSEDALENMLAADELRAGFESLNDKQRATLEMYFFEGLDLREISSRLGESLENTRHFYYRGLERLRRTVAAVWRRDRK